jgi:hypothetical protein
MKLRLRFVVHLAIVLIGLSLYGQAHAQTTCPDVFFQGEDLTWSELSTAAKEDNNYNRNYILNFRDDLLKGPENDPDPDVKAKARRFREVFDCHLANDPLLADGATATSKLAEGGASAAASTVATPVVGASGTGNDGGSLNRETDSSRMRKVHNPAADAKGCVKMIQTSSSTTVRISGNFSFNNECNSAVEIFWCFPKPDGRCGSGGTWTVSAGRGWPVMDNEASIRWGACRGRDGGGWNKGAEGATYTCHLLTW